IEGAYNDIVTKVGISRQHAKNMVENQEVLMSQLEQRRESTSGVSIDEEVTNLIKFQTAYDANARVISVLSEMLDVLINRTGV
ncbi:MAG TPA: flagellar basal body rod C-terminal domain-containing protein, partial [Tissierellaceae bacterium]|nr:flagellar basal body rod C-terminal domain-containing protein [Tissierellaceae bacterium]